MLLASCTDVEKVDCRARKLGAPRESVAESLSMSALRTMQNATDGRYVHAISKLRPRIVRTIMLDAGRE